jgi:putative ABC transport system substrate-binding protein
VSTLGPDLVGKSLEVLKQTVPGVRSIAILWHPGAAGDHTVRNMLTGAEGAGRALGVRLQFVEVRGPADLDRIFTEMTKARVGALTMLPSAPLSQQCNRLADLAAKNRLPALYISMRECVTGGGLMSYGANSQDLYSRMATYVDKILKGAQAGTLPVEQPTKFELAINLKATKALGLSIPPSVLAQADEIIQ